MTDPGRRRPSKTQIKAMIRRLASITLREKTPLFFGLLCLTGFVVANGSIPFLLGNLTDAVVDIKSKGNSPSMYQYAFTGFVIVFVYGGRGICYFGQNYLLNSIGQRLVRNLRNQLFSKAIILPFRFFQKNRTGDLISRFTTDLATLEQAIYISITGPVRDLPTILFFLGVLLYINGILFAFSLLMVPLVFLLINLFGKKIRTVSRQRQKQFGHLTGTISESITGIQVVKSFHKESFEQKKFVGENESLYKLAMRNIFISSASVPALEITAATCVSVILTYGGYQLFTNQITGGEFIQFLTAFYMLNEPIKRLNGFNIKLQEGIASAERVFEVIDKENPIIEKNVSVPLPPFKKEIAIDITRFSYDEQTVLRDIDIRIPAGSTVAFVGASGSGKSTIANLIPRFFDIERGCGGIYIDGNDIRDFDVYSLRKQVAMVDQNTVLFNDSVRGNIAYGDPEVPMEKIVEAAKQANAYDFVMELREGFEQNIGEKGSFFSGGQKQRLSIARTLLKNSSILILDEATSSLDSESEKEVQQALERLMYSRTTLIIAHRFSTIRNVETIFVMKDGRVAETGNHDSLMASKGEYFRLYSIQSEKKEAAV